MGIDASGTAVQSQARAQYAKTHPHAGAFGVIAHQVARSQHRAKAAPSTLLAPLQPRGAQIKAHAPKASPAKHPKGPTVHEAGLKLKVARARNRRAEVRSIQSSDRAVRELN